MDRAMDLRQLESFATVADSGSVSRAATALHLSQPSISRQLSLLEADLGQRLFERHGRGVRLTPAGQALLVHARTLLEGARQARRQLMDMNEEPSGRVVVGLPHRVATGLCVPLVERFRRELPNAMISISEGLSLSLREDLLQGRIDLALLFDPAPTPLIVSEPLMRERLILVAPEGTPLKSRVSLAELAQVPMILPSAPNPIRSLVDAVLLPRRIGLQIVAEVGAVHSAIALVEHGVGCSILPQSALLMAQQSERLPTALIGPPALWNRLVLAMPAARPLSRLQQATAALLRQMDFRMHH
jgi:LysR family nitrogen assimilation transcriptional regulator